MHPVNNGEAGGLLLKGRSGAGWGWEHLQAGRQAGRLPSQRWEPIPTISAALSQDVSAGAALTGFSLMLMTLETFLTGISSITGGL